MVVRQTCQALVVFILLSLDCPPNRPSVEASLALPLFVIFLEITVLCPQKALMLSTRRIYFQSYSTGHTERVTDTNRPALVGKHSNSFRKEKARPPSCRSLILSFRTKVVWRKIQVTLSAPSPPSRRATKRNILIGNSKTSQYAVWNRFTVYLSH